VLATGADVLVVDAVMKIGREIIGRMPSLKLIHSQGVAFNAIDLAAAKQAGVYVCNNPGINAQAVAEQAILLMLSLLKNYSRYEPMIYAGRQMEAKSECFREGLPELGGLTVGIIGLGAIGTALADRLKAFGCRLFYYSRTQKPACGVEYATLNELYAVSDIVSLHVPVSPETENMINAQSLTQFKKGALLINTARGDLTDYSAVRNALVSGQLGGFGADTLSPEPVLTDNPFLAALPEALRSRVALSPHVAGLTAGCFTRAYAHIFRNIAAVEKGARPDSVVNGL
jgi:phosphoglycerate dehydrogenase-like enzyme